MNRSDRRDEWERILKEPVAAVAKVRFSKDNNGTAGPLSKGTAVLTESRFLVFGGAYFTAPKSGQKFQDHLRLQFHRTDITEIELSDEKKNIFIVRYVDGNEKKISFQPGPDGNVLLKLMEQDLLGG